MMQRIFIWACAALLFHSLIGALAVAFSMQSLPVMIIPAVLTYMAFFSSPAESLATALVTGFIVDSLTGVPLGIAIIAQILVWFISAIAAAWIGKPRAVIIIMFICFMSFTYRLMLYLMQLVSGVYFGNFKLADLLLMPIVDCLIGYLIFEAILKLFSRFRLLDQSENLMETTGY